MIRYLDFYGKNSWLEKIKHFNNICRFCRQLWPDLFDSSIVCNSLFYLSYFASWFWLCCLFYSFIWVILRAGFWLCILLSFYWRIWTEAVLRVIYWHLIMCMQLIFQASWHPLHDLIVVGRYPDKEFPGYVQYERRTVDIIDANTGDIVTQLNDFSTPGIISVSICS